MADYNKIDEQLMSHLCELAKLNLADSEKKSYAKQLQEVLDAFAMIKELNVSEEPAFHSVKVENVWREDKVSEAKWDPFSNTKNTDRNHFRGPSIV